MAPELQECHSGAGRCLSLIITKKCVFSFILNLFSKPMVDKWPLVVHVYFILCEAASSCNVFKSFVSDTFAVVSGMCWNWMLLTTEHTACH